MVGTTLITGGAMLEGGQKLMNLPCDTAFYAKEGLL